MLKDENEIVRYYSASIVFSLYPNEAKKTLIAIKKKGKTHLASNVKYVIKNYEEGNNYFQKGNYDYRQYYEQTNLISQEIMKAKSPVVESGTNYLKWTVEGIQQTAKGTTYGRWELVIDPVKEVIVHFLFAS